MKKIIIYTLLLVSTVCSAQLFNPQSKEITEKFFPDFTIEIPTPAFQKEKGFTNYDEMMRFINPLINAHQEIATLSYIGESQKGLKIPMIVLSNPASKGEKVKVWLQAGIHGNEPASTEGILYLLHELLTDNAYQYLFDKLEIAIVPMANIDGSNKQIRYAANGLDLNRDQTKLNVKESISLKQAFSDFNAEVALDFHEFRPYRRDFVHFGEYGVTNPYDVMFLYSGNLNVPENLRQYTQDVFVKNAKELLEENNLHPYDYFTTSDYQGYTCFNLGSVNARSSATSYALTNTISSLIEVRGIGLGRTSFKRRTITTFLIAESYLKTAYANVDKVKQVIAKAIATQGEAVINSKRKVSRDSMTFIDLASNQKISEEIILRNALKMTPTLTRKRPTAYVLMPTETKLVKRLKTLGLNVEELSSAVTVEVENYIVTHYHQSKEKYEGVYRQKVTSQTHIVEKTFPEGSYVIYMDQKKANIAVEVLEPEADNSFISYDVLPTEMGQELPVYRYLKSKKL